MDGNGLTHGIDKGLALLSALAKDCECTIRARERLRCPRCFAVDEMGTRGGSEALAEAVMAATPFLPGCDEIIAKSLAKLLECCAEPDSHSWAECPRCTAAFDLEGDKRLGELVAEIRASLGGKR